MNSSSARRTAADSPNILLIVLDAARAKNLSCYGYHQPTMPHLARFAEECVVYEQAISAAGWSLPAHASIFTGLYPSKHGAHDQHKFLEPAYPTMAELLQSHGYQTLAFCQNQYVGPATGLQRGFGRFNPKFKSKGSLSKLFKKIDYSWAKISGQQDSGARYTNRELQAALPQLKDQDRPFFIFINYLEPHFPYRAPQRFNRFLPEGVSAKQAKMTNLNSWQYLVYPDSMTQRDFEIVEALHNSALAYLDMRIAQILDWLKTLSILDQTMVIITADHGENFGEHQLMGHGHGLYDTLLHVPLVIHYPKGAARPGRVSHQVQTLDLLPTILSLMGDTASEVYRSLQGYDLLSQQRHRFTIAEQSRPDLTPFHRRFPGVDVSRYDRALQMIRTDRYKYIWSSTNQHELYDLSVDPAEAHNLISQCPGTAEELDGLLNEWRNSFEPAVFAGEVPEFDEDIKAQLRALGYFE